jgi:hypothetical protein
MAAASSTYYWRCVQSREIYPKRRHLFTRTDVTCQHTAIPILAADTHPLTVLTASVRKVGRKFEPDDAGLDARTVGRWVGWSKVSVNVALPFGLA